PPPTRCRIAGAVANLILTSVPVSLRNTSAAATMPGSTAPALIMLISAAKAGAAASARKPSVIVGSTRLFIRVPSLLSMAKSSNGGDNTPGRRFVNCIEPLPQRRGGAIAAGFNEGGLLRLRFHPSGLMPASLIIGHFDLSPLTRRRA